MHALVAVIGPRGVVVRVTGRRILFVSVWHYVLSVLGRVIFVYNGVFLL